MVLVLVRCLPNVTPSAPCLLSTQLDERVATFQLLPHGAVLTVFTQEQADDFTGVQLEGPPKGNTAVNDLHVSVDGVVDGSM